MSYQPETVKVSDFCNPLQCLIIRETLHHPIAVIAVVLQFGAYNAVRALIVSALGRVRPKPISAEIFCRISN